MDGTTDRCDRCNARLKAFEITDPDTGKVVDTELDCPNAGYCGMYAAGGK